MPDNKVMTPERGAELFERFIVSSHEGDFDKAYYLSHRMRFEKTLTVIPPSDEAGHAIELGATNFFQILLKLYYQYAAVSGTQFSSHIEDKRRTKTFKLDDFETANTLVSIDLESEFLPFSTGSTDLVLCCELIEHLDVDPMFMLAEINRVLKDNAYLVITTPNCCSARNFWKIAHGYRPHFFMQYEKSRSPYRHNIEYDVPTLVSLVSAAGFEVEQVDTVDVFESPVPEALEFLRMHGLTTTHRGDCIFLRSRKVGPLRDRWPLGIYV